MSNDKLNEAVLNDRTDKDLRSPISVNETDKTKQAKVTSDIIKASNETQDASLRKEISDRCSTLVTSHDQGQQVNDVAKLPAIAVLYEILKQLSSKWEKSTYCSEI
ncbi:Hypothetical predicted protein [Paramuricea clavata]|uniref:Uncharacterized protein n=1 Tax=Paramuricea clavata TaxID=317549 RepID=A0A6S7G6G9_PARCT|nr:Hypothetical predicted protein [Paramuricea clavata]